MVIESTMNRLQGFGLGVERFISNKVLRWINPGDPAIAVQGVDVSMDAV